MKIKHNFLILGLIFLAGLGLFCSPVRSHSDSKQKAYSDKLAEKLVYEIHRSLYGTYGGLNLRLNHTSKASGFGLISGKLVSDLDSSGNEEWAIHIDTLIKQKNLGRNLGFSLPETKIQYNLNFTTQNSETNDYNLNPSEANKDYKIIQASSSIMASRVQMILNGGLIIQSNVISLKDSSKPSLLNLQLLFHSVSLDDHNGNLVGGKTSFHAIELEDGQTLHFKGNIQFFNPTLAKIQIGDQIYTADFNSGKVSHI